MGAKMKPRWGYVGQLGAQDGQLGSILGGILAPPSHLGMTFLKNVQNSKNIEKPKVFKGFWVVVELHMETFGGHVGLCWRILATRWAVLGHLGAMLRHLGHKMRPNSAKMSPRWRPRAPRGANKSKKTKKLKPVQHWNGKREHEEP